MVQKGGGSDKRKSPRIDFHLRVKVKGQREPKELKNFGLYGIFLQTDGSYEAKPGDEISLVMRLPHENEPLELRGKVIHVSDQGVGVAFPDLPVQDAMAMEACFNIFKETLPLPE